MVMLQFKASMLSKHTFMSLLNELQTACQHHSVNIISVSVVGMLICLFG